MKVLSFSAAETQELGERWGHLVEPGEVFLLTGELGAGKTQFVKGVARALGVREEITSPTFNLMHEYCCTDKRVEGCALRHFDLYRLERAEELDDFDYFGLVEDERAISFVEWGDKFPEALPQGAFVVAFTVADERRREIHIWGPLDA